MDHDEKYHVKCCITCLTVWSPQHVALEKLLLCLLSKEAWWLVEPAYSNWRFHDCEHLMEFPLHCSLVCLGLLFCRTLVNIKK